MPMTLKNFESETKSQQQAAAETRMDSAKRRGNCVNCGVCNRSKKSRKVGVMDQ